MPTSEINDQDLRPEQGGIDGIMDSDLEVARGDPSLYNSDLAPVKHKDRNWGWFEIFNVWSNDIQSLFGYTLAASLFIAYGLNGWAVMAAIIFAGIIVMVLVNLTGSISVKYGLPLNVSFFSFIALIILAGTVVLFGEHLTNPPDIIDRINALPLTIIAAVTFFMATVGINLVANFIPPASDFANSFPGRITFRTGGLITAVIASCTVWLKQLAGLDGFAWIKGACLAAVFYYLLSMKT